MECFALVIPTAAFFLIGEYQKVVFLNKNTFIITEKGKYKFS